MPQAILLQDHETLGERGTVVDVSKGYLRNYLIPRKLAEPATKGSIAAAQRRGHVAERALAEATTQARDNAELLQDGAHHHAPGRRRRPPVAPSPHRTSSTPSRRPAASASTAARSTSTSRSARSHAHGRRRGPRRRIRDHQDDGRRREVSSAVRRTTLRRKRGKSRATPEASDRRPRLDRPMAIADQRNGDAATAPPQNLEAEQSVLGAVLLSDTALPALIIDERLQPEDFYREAHGLIFQAMLDLHTVGEPVDALTLVEHLKQAGLLERVGGRAAVDLLAGSVPAVGNVRQYARIVRENAMLRRLLRASYEIQARVHSHEAPPREPVDLAERSILEVAHDDRRKDFRSIHDLLSARLRRARAALRRGPLDHRHAVGLRGPRPHHRRLPARRPDHPRGTPWYGQVHGGVRARLRPVDRGATTHRRGRKRGRARRARRGRRCRRGSPAARRTGERRSSQRGAARVPASHPPGSPHRRDREPSAADARGMAQTRRARAGRADRRAAPAFRDRSQTHQCPTTRWCCSPR